MSLTAQGKNGYSEHGESSGRLLGLLTGVECVFLAFYRLRT